MKPACVLGFAPYGGGAPWGTEGMPIIAAEAAVGPGGGGCIMAVEAAVGPGGGIIPTPICVACEAMGFMTPMCVAAEGIPPTPICVAP